VIVFILALIGASTQCLADCFTQPSVPPCHQHSQSKNSSPEPCKHTQPAVDAQDLCPPAAETPMLAEVALEFSAPEAALPDIVPSSLTVLRL
jgi:hypothetical protein